MKRNFQTTTLLLLLASLSCGVGSGGIAKESTLDAISASIRETATYQAAGNQNSNLGVETVQAQATAFSLSAGATQTAEAGLSDEAKAATASAVAPILAELPKYGVDPTAGRMGWIHPPVSLEVEGFMQYDYINNFIATVAGNFVVSAEITWDTIGSTSGCGFVLRSDGKEDGLNQYLAIVTRVANGHVLFATMAEGKVVTGQDIYAYGRDPNFNWQNKATNKLTVVGRENRFWIYTNDTLIGEIDPSAPPAQPNLPPEPIKPSDKTNAEAMANYLIKKAEHDAVVEQIRADFRARQQALQKADTVFERGFVAMVALSQSGRKTVCEFNNGWLWLIE